MIEGLELDEIVSGVWLDHEIIGRLELYGGPEIAEAEGDGAAIVDVARVPQQPHAGVNLVLDDLIGGGGGGGTRSAGLHVTDFLTGVSNQSMEPPFK